MNTLQPFYDFTPGQHTIREDVLHGLQQARKILPCKYFYDEVGSHLFDQICQLDEYYLTRTEMYIMQERIHEIVALLGPGCVLIEYGSGSSLKTRLLLDHLDSPVAYVPIDISREHLCQAATTLHNTYPDLEILPVCADYTGTFDIPVPQKPVTRRIAYYPGSTIGNFDPPQAQHFLARIAHTCVGGGLLIGVDLKKDFSILHRAYNDQDGITARFNLHLLERINRELAATFPLDRFEHYAFYNPGASRVEMHLCSLTDQFVQVAGTEIPFTCGESIWTESSYKYTLAEFATLASSSGFTVEHVWLDPDAFFSIQYLTTKGI